MKKTGDIRPEIGAPFYILGGGSDKYLCLYLNYPNQNKESTTYVRIRRKEYMFKTLFTVLTSPTVSRDSILCGGTYISARKVYCDGQIIIDKEIKQDTMLVTLKIAQ